MKNKIIKYFISDYYIEIFKYISNLIEKQRIKKIVNKNTILRRL